MNPLDTAMEYFRCIKEFDKENIGKVFAQDAKLRVFARGGVVRDGHEAVSDWFVNVALTAPKRIPTTLQPIVDGNRCAVEINVEQADGFSRVVDIFTVNDDGKIAELWIYQGVYTGEP